MDEERKLAVLREADEREAQEGERRRLQPVPIPPATKTIRKSAPSDALTKADSIDHNDDDEEEAESEEEERPVPRKRLVGRRPGQRKLRIRPS